MVRNVVVRSAGKRLNGDCGQGCCGYESGRVVKGDCGQERLVQEHGEVFKQEVVSRSVVVMSLEKWLK